MFFEHLEEIEPSMETSMRRAQFTLILQIVLKIMMYLALVLACVFIYFKLFHKYRMRWGLPSIMININKYNLEYTTKLTELLIGYNNLVNNQFKWGSKLNNDIYFNTLNDGVAHNFAQIDAALKQKGLGLGDVWGGTNIYTATKIAKFLTQRFERYKKYKNHETKHVDHIFERVENIVSFKDSFSEYCDNKFIMNYLDTVHLDHTTLMENTIFKKYQIFMNKSMSERYEEIKINHPTSGVKEYMDILMSDKSLNSTVDKNEDAKQYMNTRLREIVDTIHTKLVENTDLSMDEMKNVANDNASNLNNVDRLDHDALLTEAKEIEKVFELLENDDFESMNTSYYFQFEHYLYNTYKQVNGVQTNVFDSIDIDLLLSKYQNVLDITHIYTNYDTIDTVMDFTLNYVLDHDKKKFDKLMIYNELYITLFDFIAYHEKNFDRLVRYNRSRWPILPELQRVYTKQFKVVFDILLIKNVVEQWKSLGRFEPTMFEPIARAIDNLLNPAMILKSLL